jgi:hypothetical protein
MSCCGSKRQPAMRPTYANLGAAARAPGSAAPNGPDAAVVFVYDGIAPLILAGSASGRRYRFAERGDRLAVDPRDAPALDAVPQLRRLSA